MTVDEAINSWRVAPFARGSTDCCAFVDHVLYAMTGKRYLPSYRTDEGAESIVDQHGSLKDAVTHYFGKEPVDELEPGDIALVDVFGNQSIGVMKTAESVAVIFEVDGLREIRADFVDCGWKLWA